MNLVTYCAAFMAENITVNVTIPTQTDSITLVSVFGWIVIYQHVDDTLDWNRPWADYKAGFGSIDGNFWLGLENMHLLSWSGEHVPSGLVWRTCIFWLRLENMHLLTTSQPYRVRFEIQQQTTGLWYSAEYQSFTVGDESNDQYRVNADGFSGDTEDGFYAAPVANAHDGMSFTTYDQDNDLSAGGNCAVWWSGGFWFKECYWWCLTCQPQINWFWENGDGVSRVISVSRMMIKPQ